MDRYSRVWNVGKPSCDAGALTGFVSIGLRDCWPAIQVLLVGSAVAAAILLAETLLHKVAVENPFPLIR